MRPDEACALIAPAVLAGEAWADLGAGEGTFSAALSALLGPAGRVVAVDRNRAALARVAGVAGGATVTTLQADFTQALALPTQDGLLLANSLHFVPDARAALERLLPLHRPSGKLLVLEYDEARASRWGPYPLPFSRLERLAHDLRLPAPQRIAEHPSRYHAAPIYAALIRLP